MIQKGLKTLSGFQCVTKDLWSRILCEDYDTHGSIFSLGALETLRNRDRFSKNATYLDTKFPPPLI
jgi:hypothetical protein